MTFSRPKSYVVLSRGPRHSGGRLVIFDHICVENTYPRKYFMKHVLGFKHICDRTRSGRFQLKRKSPRDRMRVKLKALKAELWQRMHEPIPEQGKWLAQVVRGYFAYHAVPTNFKSLDVFRYHVTDLWRRTLRRRGQRDSTTGNASRGSRPSSCPNRASCISGPMSAFSSITRGGSRVPELGPLGFVRGRPAMSVPTAIQVKLQVHLSIRNAIYFHKVLPPIFGYPHRLLFLDVLRHRLEIVRFPLTPICGNPSGESGVASLQKLRDLRRLDPTAQLARVTRDRDDSIDCQEFLPGRDARPQMGRNGQGRGRRVAAAFTPGRFTYEGDATSLGRRNLYFRRPFSSLARADRPFAAFSDSASGALLGQVQCLHQRPYRIHPEVAADILLGHHTRSRRHPHPCCISWREWFYLLVPTPLRELDGGRMIAATMDVHACDALELASLQCPPTTHCRVADETEI